MKIRLHLLLKVCLLITSVSPALGQTITITKSGDGTTVQTSSKRSTKKIATATMEFIYDHQWSSDTSDSSKVKSDLMILQIGPDVSRFYSYKAWQLDSLIANTSAQQIMANPGQFSGKGGERYEIHKFNSEGKLFFTDKIGDDIFLYEEPLPDLQWELVDGEKQIVGYGCKQAKCSFRGRDYVAWYTDEIPVLNGPWKFGGLPGLITEIYDTQGHYRFTLTGIRPHVSTDITLADKNFMKTTRKKYQQLKYEFQTNPVAYLRNNAGVKIEVSGADGKPMPDDQLRNSLKYEYIERDIKLK